MIRFFDNIIPLEKIVSGSCLLGDGLGEKILVKIFMEFQIKTISDLDKIELAKLKAINGIEEKTAKKILLNIGKVKEFLQENQNLKFIVSHEKNEGLFKDLNIVLTGKRDKEIIEFINSNGGEIKSVVNKNTAFIIVDDLSQSSSKLEIAKKLKVKIYSCQEFKNKYQM